MSESAGEPMKHAAPAEGVFVLPRGKGFSFAQRVLAVRLFALILGTLLLAWFFVQVANRGDESEAASVDDYSASAHGLIHELMLIFTRKLATFSVQDGVYLVVYLALALGAMGVLCFPARKLDRMIRSVQRT